MVIEEGVAEMIRTLEFHIPVGFVGLTQGLQVLFRVSHRHPLVHIAVNQQQQNTDYPPSQLFIARVFLALPTNLTTINYGLLLCAIYCKQSPVPTRAASVTSISRTLADITAYGLLDLKRFWSWFKRSLARNFKIHVFLIHA